MARKAVSEQQLAEQALARLPGDGVVLADGNFGISAFAYAVQRSQRPLLFRLTAARARKILAVSSRGKQCTASWFGRLAGGIGDPTRTCPDKSVSRVGCWSAKIQPDPRINFACSPPCR